MAEADSIPLRDWRSKPRKHRVDPEWLREEYEVKRRRVGDIAAELGCSLVHLNSLVAKFGIPRRDGRAGRMLPTRRVSFPLERAKWMYVIERLSCEDIGNVLGVNGSTIQRRLSEAGVPIRPCNETKRGAKSRNRSSINERKVVKEYLKPKASISSVAQAFEVSNKVVARVLTEHRVPRKPIDEVREIVTGPAHPSWRHDISPEERAMRRDGNRQNEWRMLVYQRDGFTCQRCGDDKGGNLHAHHIIAHCENKDLRWDLDNGITFCVGCHRQFHRTYGLKGFGQVQLIEYLQTAS